MGAAFRFAGVPARVRMARQHCLLLSGDCLRRILLEYRGNRSEDVCNPAESIRFPILRQREMTNSRATHAKGVSSTPSAPSSTSSVPTGFGWETIIYSIGGGLGGPLARISSSDTYASRSCAALCAIRKTIPSLAYALDINHAILTFTWFDVPAANQRLLSTSETDSRLSYFIFWFALNQYALLLVPKYGAWSHE